jgi:glycosyltransferase involved in cell wall biosynthesis
MTQEPLRVLCLDVEGGYGGSSRSLYESLRNMDRTAVTAEVWCRREGPIQDRYRKIGIDVAVKPQMPRVSSLPRLSRNLLVYTMFARDWLRSRPFRNELVRALNDRFDLLHCNHEGLFLLARWVRKRTSKPIAVHVRTNIADTLFARWQQRVLLKAADGLIFITENERATAERQSGQRANGTIIYNIAEPPSDRVEAYEQIPVDGRFKLACIANYAWVRGLDRTIGVAETLKRHGRTDVLFVMAGNTAMTRSDQRAIGPDAAGCRTLADYVKKRGLGDMFCFLGHVPEPERVLAAVDALYKPSRENNPWGRDILEALAAGTPVVSIGTYEAFVEHGVTGILRPHHDDEQTARDIAGLADDRARARKMGLAGRARIEALCSGGPRAADLAAAWQGLKRS